MSTTSTKNTSTEINKFGGTVESTAKNLSNTDVVIFGGSQKNPMDRDYVFSSKVDKALSTVLPSTDPFDSPYFDPISYINERFPTEESLHDVEGFILKIKKRIHQTDNEILKAVKQQSSVGPQSEKELHEAKQSIKDLMVRIKGIQKKAEESEKMVEEITSDIKALDFGKKNISNTIRTLTNLQLYEKAVSQVKTLTDKQQYMGVGNLLKDVADFEKYFSGYVDVPKIKDLKNTADQIKVSLKKNLLTDFNTLDTNTEFRDSLLHEACQAVDALGPTFTQEIILSFIKKNIEFYKEKFPPRLSDFENYASRFGWLRKKLKDISEDYNVIPKHWNLQQEMSVEFCIATRDIYSKMLKDVEVGSFVKVLQQTIRFEKELTARFQETPNYKFHKLISGGFDDFMYKYLEDQDLSMGKKIQKLLQDEKWQLNSEFDSGKDLFLIIESSLETCLPFDKGRILMALIEIWKKHILNFAQALVDKLPKPPKERQSTSAFDLGTYLNFMTTVSASGSVSGSGSTTTNTSSSDAQQQQGRFKFSEKDEMTVCYIISVAEYCHQQIVNLQQVLISNILDQEFHDKLEFQKEKEKLYLVLNSANNLFVMNIMNQIHDNFECVWKNKWTDFEHVGDESEYVTAISKKLHQIIPSIKAKLSTSHFITLCEKFVITFFSLFANLIKRNKRLSNAAAQQLLVDVISLSNFLKTLVTASSSTGSNDSLFLGPDETQVNRFVKVLKTQVAKPENILKVVLAPPETMAETFENLMKKSPPEELNLLMEIKGITKPEQSSVLSKRMSMRDGSLSARGEIGGSLAVKVDSARIADSNNNNNSNNNL